MPTNRIRLMTVLLILLPLLAPRMRAQTVALDTASMDVWRNQLGARLDQDLARLAGQPSAIPAGLAEVRWTVESVPGPSLVSMPPSGVATTTVAAILRQQGLPPGLLAVPSIESGWKPKALSPKGARGLWQLMPSTARRYGLVVESQRDDRLDPLKATFAATRYLRELYTHFGDWPLALAAYNAGEDRIQQLLEREQTHDFWRLSRSFAVPEETRRYVPAVLARAGSILDTASSAAPLQQTSADAWAFARSKRHSAGRVMSPACRLVARP